MRRLTELVSLRALAIGLLLALLVVLAACGGGGDDGPLPPEDPEVRIDPPACAENRELCK